MSSINEEVEHLKIPLQELSEASNGFSKRNLIAKGGYGKVYKGISAKHGNIAIKVLDPKLGQGEHEFRTEIALLSVYKHENIVSLLGFCDEGRYKILVYKFESKGSLDKHLDSADLSWIQRLRVCLDAARGLRYLHDDVGAVHRIIHRDVKSSNILLDEDWKAKITDFGLSRVGPANMQSTFVISNVCGTIGYIDPDYYNTGYLTQKSDVYSFGVVLFEVLCGRHTRLTPYKDERQFLTNLIKIHWKRNTLDEIIHLNLHKQIKGASLLTFSKIAYQCLMSVNERPTMKEVVEQLQKALDNQLAPNGPGSENDDFVANHQGQSAWSLASSSQSTPPPPPPPPPASSSSQLWMLDVFISHAKEVTGPTFGYRLYKALISQQVITYNDSRHISEMWGRYIDESRIEVIQKSRIAIIIFTRYYVTSSWHLDELACIMKNMEERGKIVIPIFNEIKPSDVRSVLTGGYAEQLRLDEVKHNDNKLKSWSEALVRAADLSGWEIPDWRYELKYIPKIVGGVSNILMEHSEASAETSAYTYLIGIEVRMQELKLLLEVGTGGVKKVGISGMWGSGKSILASSIYDEISHEFEGCCFVKNVRARSRMHGLKMLQEEILSNVLKVKVTLTDIDQGINMMERRLRRNSVLIVLDDVDHIDHLEMLVGSCQWFGDGSRIIITTRNKGLVDVHRFLEHNVKMLDRKESTELFNRHAFGESKPAQGFEDISLNIVSKFGGHPSALISMGSILHGKGMSVWMRVLDRLASIPADKILKKFETPDDRLPTNTLLHFLLEGDGSVSP